MTNRLWVGLLVLAAAGGLLWADEPKGPRAAGEFVGKIVYVQARGAFRPDRHATLENAAVRSLGGRPFLVGKGIDDGALAGASALVGAEVWVPIDEVEAMAVYDSLAHLRRAAGR